MFPGRFPDGGINADPIAHGRHFTKRHTGLRHAKRSRVHAQENDSFFTISRKPQILLVGRPGIVERVVNVSDNTSKVQPGNRRAQVPRSLKNIARHIHVRPMV